MIWLFTKFWLKTMLEINFWLVYQRKLIGLSHPTFLLAMAKTHNSFIQMVMFQNSRNLSWVFTEWPVIANSTQNHLRHLVHSNLLPYRKNCSQWGFGASPHSSNQTKFLWVWIRHLFIKCEWVSQVYKYLISIMSESSFCLDYIWQETLSIVYNKRT